ncbi:cytochrome P450 [Mycena epipterygia]|nr:cytochrome P450 [Mycena epipterygia]
MSSQRTQATPWHIPWTPLWNSKLPLPPGPKKMPIVGNLFHLPLAFQWETYKDWSQQFKSDIIQFDLVGTSVVVLSSLETTEALLDKRSSIYSDRPRSPMFDELMGWTYNLGALRVHRCLFSQGFNVPAARNFHPKELAATHGLLRRLLHTPEDFRDHIRRMAGEIIISVAYGFDVLPVNDPYLAVAEQAVHIGQQVAIPGRFLVDSIPLLKHIPDWFPGAGFKRLAKEGREVGRALVNKPFAEVKRQLVSDRTHQHICSSTYVTRRLVSESDDKYYGEDTVKETAATMYVAGADTTVTALAMFFLAMLANPEAQRKAPMEIDAVLGKEQLPSFDDEQSLPYVSALVKEVFRWHPVAPIGLQFITAFDEYRGYRIPADSVVIGNVWAILHNEEMYPEPSAFNPERFLRDGKPNPDVRDPQAAFGFGRRICPGRHMAMSLVWITIASVLAGFDITKAVGDDGLIIEPTYQYSPYLMSAPLPFKCSIRPRSPDVAALIEATINGGV